MSLKKTGRKKRRNGSRRRAWARKPLTLTGVTGRVVMAVSAALLILSFLSVVVNPAKVWIFAIFGMLFMPLFLFNLFLFLWALKRRSRSALIPLVAVLPSVFFAGGYFQFPFGQGSGPQEDSPTVKVVSYNVGRFLQANTRKVAKGRKACMDSVRTFLVSQDADIICLQEFYTPDIDRVKAFLSNWLKGYSAEYYFFKGRYGYYGNVTFSRLRAKDKGVIHFEDSRNLAIYTDYSYGGNSFRVYNCHFESYNISASGLLRSVRKSDSESLKATEQKFLRGLTRRPRQVSTVLGHIADSPVESFVCGDFNDTPMSYTYFRLSGGRNDTFREAGKWFGSSFSFMWPLLRIDYILSPKEYVPISHKTPHEPYSDHYPVISRLALESKGI